MTRFVTKSNANVLVKLSGRIVDFKCTRARASFVFNEADRTKMGAVAIAAGLAGMGGQAMSTAANAGDLEEEGDYLEFTLDGKALSGWVWRSPFKEGDEVEIAAETDGDRHEIFGVARPSDRTIALYPHCSRGRTRHFINAAKWWLILSGSGVLFVSFMMRDSLVQAISERGVQWEVFSFFAFFGAMVFSLSHKWFPFVRVAENVLRTLGWPNPGSIDLVTRTRARRSKDDPVEYGRFYFYY